MPHRPAPHRPPRGVASQRAFGAARATGFSPVLKANKTSYGLLAASLASRKGELEVTYSPLPPPPPPLPSHQCSSPLSPSSIPHSLAPSLPRSLASSAPRPTSSGRQLHAALGAGEQTRMRGSGGMTRIWDSDVGHVRPEKAQRSRAGAGSRVWASGVRQTRVRGSRSPPVRQVSHD